MRKLTTKYLMLGLLAGTGTVSVSAESQKIVVGIMVDQLRTDYLEQLRPYFSENGFNRLITQGVYIPDVDFKGTVGDAPTGAAVVYTGAWPAVNGVAGTDIVDGNLKQRVPTLATGTGKSRYDFSPENLKLSTIADELFINNGPLTKIYSVAGDPQVAVVQAGHAGTSAVWFDEATGRWSTPNYYGTLPPAIGNKNRTSPLSSKIAGTGWKPTAAASRYGMGSIWNPGDFSYSFAGGNRDAYSRFKESAPFNSEVTESAIDLLKAIRTSGTSQPGMLNLSYSLRPISFDYDQDSRPELVDSYIKLDAEIARLLEAIDKDFGAGNAVVFLSSTGYAQEPSIPETEAKIPTGEVTLKQVESLLNAYLSATYGNADYVALINGGNLYLDRKAIESKGVGIDKIRGEAKEFLLKMSGISEVFTIDEIYRSDNRRLAALALSINAKHSPDLLIQYNPGWTLTDDNVYPSKSEKIRLSAPATPAFIMAGGIEPHTITETVEAVRIAPTITSIIHIRAPNGAGASPLHLK